MDYQTALKHLSEGRYEEARTGYTLLLSQLEMLPIVLNDMGVTWFMQGNSAQALQWYDAALLLNQAYAPAHQNRGNALAELGRDNDAMAAYYAAMARSQDKAWCLQVGHQILTRLSALGSNEDIEPYWIYLLQRYPDDAGILHNYANHLSCSMCRYKEAMDIYQRLEHHPDADPSQVYNDWGVALKGIGQTAQARQMYQKALELKPFMPLMYSNLLFDSLYEPDLDEAWLLELHQNYEKTQAFTETTPFPHECSASDRERLLRIGYLSSDFRSHSVGLFTLQPILNHDKEKFEIFLYYNSSQHDQFTEQFRQHASVWRNVDGVHPADIARLIKEDAVDILIDLNGHTKGNVLPALLYKPAPLQISWLGYVHSLGLSSVDYFMTDAVADPPGMTEQHFSEQLLRLPDSFLCFSPYDNAPECLDTPAVANGHITFGLVGNFAKINPFMVRLYGRVMGAIPGSRCLVRSSGMADTICRDILITQLAAEGITADRLTFVQRTDDTEEYLRTFREIDILFDFYPFNGETITCAALQMGTPMVSLVGASHRSRAGLSILTALGHPEWSAETAEGFVAAAIQLASDLPELNRLHLGLREQFLTSPLCDGAGFTRNLEKAYREIWHAWVSATTEAAAETSGEGTP